MESQLGESLEGVRLHDDAAADRLARSVGAHAFTTGEHLFFAADRYSPGSAAGRERLAHELVHVVQQRRGAAGHAPGAGTEAEARRLGVVVAAGRAVRVQGAAVPSSVQRDEATPQPPGSLGPMYSPDATPRLKLDPEIEALMLRNYVRWWLGTTLATGGDAPTTLPSPDEASAETEPGATAEPKAAGLPGALLPPLPTLPLAPDLFAPLPPDRLFIEPDVGAVFAPFGLRGATPGPGDYDVVLGIYRRNEALVRRLPDLRAIAPGFIKPLIPSTWRRDIASALTGAAVDTGLKHDFASPIEVSDRAFEAMTGAGTTMIPLPSISFDFLGGGK